MGTLPSSADVVVVGAGIVGAACALSLARAGLSVAIVDRGPVGGGTTSRGEGNILLSDKGSGPELDLALVSRQAWLDLGDELGPDTFELEAKGGLVVALEADTLPALRDLADEQRRAGVVAEPVPAGSLRDLEPHLTPAAAGGFLYPQDLQVQPVMAAAALVGAARRLGAVLCAGTEVLGAQRAAGGHVIGVRTTRGSIATGTVVNAAGTWGGEVGRRLGGPIPVLPRRGTILVTEPLPRLVQHKVYTAEYVANVASGEAGLETSTVVEGTRGGTILIGATRERVGFDALAVTGGAGPVGTGCGRVVPGAARRVPPAPLHRVPAVLPRPPPGDRTGPAGAGPHPRVWARGRRDRPGDRDRPAGRGDRHGQRDALRGNAVQPRSPVRIGRSGMSEFDFDGRPVPFATGQSVGAALTAVGIRSWRTTRVAARPRGLFCGIGICFDCLVVVDGVPNQRACLVIAAEDMSVSVQEATGHDDPPR